jgi:signal peptidase II
MRITAQTAFIIFVIDQLSKWVVVHAFNLRSVGEIDVFPPFLVFRMAWNTGINFGLFSEYAAMLRWGWVALAVVMSVWVLTWVRRENFGFVGKLSAGLLVGGALGNAIDRVVASQTLIRSMWPTSRFSQAHSDLFFSRAKHKSARDLTARLR